MKMWRCITRIPLERISQAFIQTFGITPPSPEREKAASLFIVSLLLLVVLFGVFAGIFLFWGVF